MKTVSNYFSKILSVVMLLTFVVAMTSCDSDWWDEHRNDYKQSKALSGQWTGDLNVYCSYNGRNYEASYTDIVFYPDYNGATHGYGYQVDFFAQGPYERVNHKFKWEVRKGVVELDYYHNSYLDTRIRDYNMDNRYFEGYFGDSDVRFKLHKIENYYDWTPYFDNYNYSYRRD